ncbi:MAG: SRPBCC family protein [Planctomycetota bacterium]
MNDQNGFAKLTSPTKLEITRLLPASQRRVWDYLVDPELRKLWFCAGETGSGPGEPFVMDFDHSRLSTQQPPEGIECGDPITMHGMIVTFDPPKELSYNWPDESDGPGTLVTIRLSERDGATELHLTHERLTGPEFRTSASAGWHAHLDLLVDLASGNEPRDFWAHYAQLKSGYAAQVDQPA